MHLANARLVLSDRIVTGSVVVEEGRIADITEGDRVPRGAVDCGGDWLLPGLVELHTDNLERHMQPRPGVKIDHPLAILAHDGEVASCGITTVFDAVRVGSDRDAEGLFGSYARVVASQILALRDAGVLRARHRLHLRAEVCSDTLIEELATFGPDDRVGLVSVMDHTPGQRQFRDLSKLKEYRIGKHGLSEAVFDQMVAQQLARRARIGDAHDQAAVAAAKRCGAVLASHDDTTTGQVAVSSGLGIRLAEFPTTLEAAEACRAQGIAIIMGAPNILRGGSHSGNVAAQDLAQQNLLDIVSSDYIPSALLQAAFQLAALWGDLPRAIRSVTENPARAVGLSDRGQIAAGCLGDLVRVGQLGATPVVRNVWRGGCPIG